MPSETSPLSVGRLRGEALDLAVTLVLALGVWLVLRTVLFEPFTIPSSSMEPGLRTGDYIVVSKYSYGWSRYSAPFLPFGGHGRLFGREPKRGDVIVFKLPRDEGKTDYVKRLIGLPGDQVQLVRGVVHVNGRPIPQTPAGDTIDPDDPGRPVHAVLEPRADGKPYATFHEGSDHEGETTAVYRVPAGQYFFLGDNRDNSLDSRWPKAIGVGYVPAENLVGKAQIILGSWRPGAAWFKPWTWVTHGAWDRFLHLVR